MDNMGYRIERLEVELEKLRTEIHQNEAPFKSFLTKDALDSLMYWAMVVVLLVFDIIVRLASLSLSRALIAALIMIGGLAAIKLMSLIKKKNQQS